MSLKDIDIKGSYTGKGITILNDFLKPVLSKAVSYDRISGYFTIDSLLSIANGIDDIRKKRGKMRLIVGVHSIPKELIDATINKKQIQAEINKINKIIADEISNLSDLLEKKKVATLAWMIDEGLLSVRAAAVCGSGIFHPKTLIIKDEIGNEVVAVGSSNETRNGLGGNFEQLMVATSWNNLDAVNDQKSFFYKLWENKDKEAIVFDLTEDIAYMIKNSLGNDYHNLVNMLSTSLDDVFSKIVDMPINYFISGNIPSLYVHQERAVLDALSRWPVRALFCDEVGLGKTFEAAATLTFLNTYCNVKRIIILTPKSVLSQWQDELKTHFGLNVWLFDSNKKSYISTDNKIKYMGNRNPLGKDSPNMILMSSQYARGNKHSKGLLSKNDTILPDLLVVDEAHSARISEDISGNNHKTQMYKMLENVCRKIPHIILATATPMQKKSEEYHAMLKLLGLPKIWEKEDNFRDSLKYIMKDSIYDSTDANTMLSLLHFVISKMKPDLSILSEDEKLLLDKCEMFYKENDKFEKANFVKSKWSKLKPIFIKLHPARLLTVRNTRRSLSELGYKFPKRNLYEKTLYDSDEIKLLYRNVNDYLETCCFSVEKELNPDKKLNIGFIKISYQQRVASSLYSCKMSLERRIQKIEDIKNQLDNELEFLLYNEITLESDDIDMDELLDIDCNVEDLVNNSKINIENLRRAVNSEYLSLQSLIREVNAVLNIEGDQKIDESINLASKVLNQGDSVLLFSRYTDTVDALIKVFNKKNEKLRFNYAIYTGNKSLIVKNGRAKECDKNQIKKALFAKEIRIVFCSDAASEGLNLQAARVLINVDVPWTPARLEQRIGRIARLGQTADEVDVYNMWYPNSVEAKMYKRIQSRLKNANIAVGEFPEIVSENIKNSILHNEDDKSLEMLADIRNNTQKDALDKLWLNQNMNLTYSDMIRQKLIEICKQNLEMVSNDELHKIYTFKNSENNLVELTSVCGLKESVSLKTLQKLQINKELFGVNAYKNSGFYTGVVDAEGRMITTSSILDSVLTGTCKYDSFRDYPEVLPQSNRLDLSYAVDGYDEDIPNFWIKK